MVVLGKPDLHELAFLCTDHIPSDRSGRPMQGVENYSLCFSSSKVNCFGKSTGTTMPMGSPRLIVVGLVSCNRKLAVKAS
jgi:hypothetical protein